ncbi:MAG: glutathione S-transferase [Cellvibrionaceae bacterium]
MKNTRPILYSFRRCPYAIRTRMVLQYSDIDYELREVVLKSKPSSMLSFSPKGTVPVLVLDNHNVIDESRDVIDWSLRQHDPENWKLQLSKDESKQLIDRNDGEFKHYLDRYKYFERYPESSQHVYREKAEEFLSLLNNILENNQYLSADKMSAVDVSIFPFVRQFAFVDKDWFDKTQYTHLQRWLNQFLQSDMFTAVMHKHKPWQDVSL